ncbi:MAG: DUF87 domain-containing protein [Helicobacteraceae bacterium]|jgi:hypothetical protein|nr:DUF87 domain-containing protein [Helicobacteraceae bacterium]
MSGFYLGRTLEGKRFELDPKALLTHAAIIGMTGSGKTGLGIALLEEALLSGVSAIAIDPKGDLSNLLLTFPTLSEGEFAPWADNPVSAAAEWREGLAKWDLGAERIAALKQCAEFKLYTPGAARGKPINALGSFAAPPKAVMEDGDLLSSLINSSATNLLGFINVSAETAGKESTLLGAIIGAAWTNGEDLDLEKIILRIVKPPFNKVGVFELESFIPENKRFELAAKFNSLIASGAFSAWARGDPLSIEAIYSGAKPTIAIFSISHLSDKERMFFVTLLLNSVLAWMRSRDGSPALRSLLYMDEIFGYFPPSANPPSKTPMLTLLKQARAFGLGVVLSTQNPVDLDYKGLSNIGSWFIGRLQTAQDRERVGAGLIGVSADFDKKELVSRIASLSKRRFLVKTDRLGIFETRWTLSYLKGPLSRDQIRLLAGSEDTAEEITPSASVTLDANAGRKKAAIINRFDREKKRLSEKRSRLLIKLDKEQSDVKRSAIGTIASIGTGLLGALFGSKRSAATKIAGAVKSAAAVQKERDDAARVREEIAAADREMQELEDRKNKELAELGFNDQLV